MRNIQFTNDELFAYVDGSAYARVAKKIKARTNADPAFKKIIQNLQNQYDYLKVKNGKVTLELMQNSYQSAKDNLFEIIKFLKEMKKSYH